MSLTNPNLRHLHHLPLTQYLEERWAFVAEEQRTNLGDSFDLRFTSIFSHCTGETTYSRRRYLSAYRTDLALRNIFIDVESGAINGVLDRDQAESAPVEAA